MASGRAEGRRFDRDHGVTTQAILFLNDLDADVAGDAGAHATHYEPVPVREFHDLIALLPDGVVERSAFVDAGAGMGRAVLLASLYPFRSILGIEVSAALYEVARENLSRARGLEQRCRDIRLVRDDARIARYPAGDLVVFFYNPFDGAALRVALTAAVADRDATVFVLYHTDAEATVLRDAGFAETGRTDSGACYCFRRD